MKKIVSFLAPVFLATTVLILFLTIFTFILHVNPNGRKIDALSSAIMTFEKMLADNQKNESIPLDNVVATEKAIRKFQWQRRGQIVGNYIVATLLGLVAAGFSFALILSACHRIGKPKSGGDQAPDSLPES